MSSDPAAAPVYEEDAYPGSAMVGAAIATFFFPVISLIAALMLMSGQRSVRKREQLRMWAWASFAWIAVQVLFFLLLVLAAF